MTIQWFPGHMAKAKKEIQQQLSVIDVVIELRDARAPESSKNPLLDRLIQNKKRLILLTKRDLADENETKRWLTHYQNKNQDALAIDVFKAKEIKTVRQKLMEMTQPEREKALKKGLKHKSLRLMIVGIPNVGKSTFINQFTRQKKAAVGNKPGVTKGQQWIRLDKDFELLDTPGILWPKFEDPEAGIRLALTTAIKESVYPKDDVALYLLGVLMDEAEDKMLEHLPLKKEELHPPYPDLLMTLTKNFGMKEDYTLASEKLIRLFAQGQFGRITLDKEEESEWEEN